MQTPIIVPIEELSSDPYASVLCFPKSSKDELESRIQELCLLGVSALEFSGTASIFGVKVPVLGKGFVGIVVIAHVNGQRVAVKILRRDAGREDLLHEASMLSKANSMDVGPRLFAASKNFILMQLVDGTLLANWLKTNKNVTPTKIILREVLEQCFKLDQSGLDHGELSKAPKHILVDKSPKPFIVDFETASINRKVANVTAVCQFLFIGKNTTARIISDILGVREMPKIIDALKNYKKNKNKQNFERIVEACFY